MICSPLRVICVSARESSVFSEVKWIRDHGFDLDSLSKCAILEEQVVLIFLDSQWVFCQLSASRLTYRVNASFLLVDEAAQLWNSLSGIIIRDVWITPDSDKFPLEPANVHARVYRPAAVMARWVFRGFLTSQGWFVLYLIVRLIPCLVTLLCGSIWPHITGLYSPSQLDCFGKPKASRCQVIIAEISAAPPPLRSTGGPAM